MSPRLQVYENVQADTSIMTMVMHKIVRNEIKHVPSALGTLKRHARNVVMGILFKTL